MAFKMELDSLDGLPEEVAKEYVEKDGKFVIQVEGMKTQEDVNRVQNALNAERTAHTALKEKVKTTFGTMSNPSMNRYTLKSVRLSGAKLRIIE